MSSRKTCLHRHTYSAILEKAEGIRAAYIIFWQIPSETNYFNPYYPTIYFVQFCSTVPKASSPGEFVVLLLNVSLQGPCVPSKSTVNATLLLCTHE